MFDESVVCGTCDGGLTKLNKNSLIDMTPFPIFDLVFIDEAHHIKNPNTYAYQAAHMFCDNAESIVLLTATPGVGENNKVGRAEISKYLGFLGTEIDDEKNNVRGEDRVISKDGCKVVMLCVPTNEELAIARQTLELVK